MNNSTLDTWHEFAAAVAYVADIERPGITVWDALAEALHHWLDDRPTTTPGGDELRAVLADVFCRSPEFGAPGGVHLGAILETAMDNWASAASADVNDGRSFYS